MLTAVNIPDTGQLAVSNDRIIRRFAARPTRGYVLFRRRLVDPPTTAAFH